MALTRAVVALLLAASVALAQELPSGAFERTPAWRHYRARLAKAPPIERRALVWLAWQVRSGSPAAAEAMARIGDPPIVLPDDAPPEPDLLADEGEVAAVASARRLFEGLERALGGPSATPLEAVDGLRGGPALERALWALLAARPVGLDPLDAAPLDGSGLRRALYPAVGDALPPVDDELLARLVEAGRAPDAPGWLGPLLLVALGADGRRAVDVALRAQVWPVHSALVRAWWRCAEVDAEAETLASALEALPEGGLRRSSARVVAEVRADAAAGSRPPDEEEWDAATPARRLELLELQLRCGAGALPCPRGQGRSAIGQLEALGWAALPRLLLLADDELLGPGPAACAALAPYLGPAARTTAARAAWWGTWGRAGPASWWGGEWRSTSPRFDERRIWSSQQLLRALADLPSGIPPEVAGRLPAPEDEAGAAEWIALLEARAPGTPAVADLLAAWQGVTSPQVAWAAALALGARGDPRAHARLAALGVARHAAGLSALPALEALLGQEAAGPGLALGEALLARGWGDPELLATLTAAAQRPAGRLLLLRVAAEALRVGDRATAAQALDPFGPGPVDAGRVADLLAASGEGPAVRRAALLLGRVGLDRLSPGLALAAGLVSDEPARVDSACAEVKGSPLARAAVGAALLGDVAPSGSAGCGLPLAAAAPAGALPASLAEPLGAWRALDGRALGALLAAWRADPDAPPGLELGLARAPRGRFALRARPLAARAPGRFVLEVDGPSVRLEGPATDAAIADALASALVDLLLAPDALVDLRLRVWR